MSDVQKPRWKVGLVRLSLSKSLFSPNPNIKTGSDVDGAVLRSINAWRNVANIEFSLEKTDVFNVSPPGVLGDGINVVTIAPTSENVIMMGADSDRIAAKTRVFHNGRGAIREADILLSPFQQFSTDGSYGTYDLEMTLTHEIGHLLGLRHSSVLGSIMYDSSARNGDFGTTAGGRHSLSSDDISGLLDLYETLGEGPCCGSVSGKLSGMDRSANESEIWVEDVKNGDVVGHTSMGLDGTYRIGGLANGKYRVLLRWASKISDYSIAEVGEVDIGRGDNTILNAKIRNRPRNFSIFAIGGNGVLSDSTLTLTAGRALTLFVGGRNISAEDIEISFSSPKIHLDPSSVRNIDYGQGISAIMMQVDVELGTPVGDYSVCATNHVGISDCIIGGISIRKSSEQ